MCISERLKLVLDAKNMTVTEFSNVTGISYRSAMNYLNEGRDPSVDALVKIYKGLGINITWLLTGSQEERVLQRLEVLVKSNNGFEISYEDLRLRGPGDILGTRQSGVPDFILGNIVEDTAMINQARKDALKVMESADNPDYQILLESVRKRNEKNAEYAD